MRFKRIKDLREDHDKFQKDIAQLLGISQQYYSEYEKELPISDEELKDAEARLTRFAPFIKKVFPRNY